MALENAIPTSTHILFFFLCAQKILWNKTQVKRKWGNMENDGVRQIAYQPALRVRLFRADVTVQ